MHIHIGNAVVEPGLPGYGDLHPRFGWPGGANDVPELVDFIRGLFKIGYLSEGEARPGSVSRSSRRGRARLPSWSSWAPSASGRKRGRGERGGALGAHGATTPLTRRALARRGVSACVHSILGATRCRDRKKICRSCRPPFAYWEKTKDLIDQLIDIMLNYRQSGHPGGSRSKVHILVTTLLSGAMRWDIRHPEKRFGDRFRPGRRPHRPAGLLHAGRAQRGAAHQARSRPATRATRIPNAPRARAVLGGPARTSAAAAACPGHAEMEGKTLFLKFNTGPSGPRLPRRGRRGAGAQARRRAGRQGLRHRGRGRADPGRHPRDEELRLGPGAGQPLLPHRLERLRHRRPPGQQRRCYGTPADWFGSHGWRVFGTEQGSDWAAVTRTLLAMATQGQSRPAARTWPGSRRARAAATSSTTTPPTARRTR